MYKILETTGFVMSGAKQDDNGVWTKTCKCGNSIKSFQHVCDSCMNKNKQREIKQLSDELNG